MKVIMRDGTHVELSMEPSMFAKLYALVAKGTIIDLKLTVSCPLTWLPIPFDRVDAPRTLAQYGIDVVVTP
jgi:hypothetical protein